MLKKSRGKTKSRRTTRVKLANALQNLQSAELVRMTADDAGDYLFKHALVQDTAYASLLKQERKRLHRLIAETLEKFATEQSEERAALLAHHYGVAEDHAKTFEYATQAGGIAAGRFANVEARQQYLKALDAWARLPDTSENRRTHIDTILRYVELSANSDETSQNLTRLEKAHALSEMLPQDSANEEDTLRLARVHYYAGLVRVMRNELREALGEFEQVLPVAQAYGKQEMIVIPSNFIGRLFFAQGHFDKAQELFAQAVMPLEHSANWTEWILTTGFLGNCLSARGAYAEGYEHCERALARAQIQNDPSGLAVAQVFRAFHYLMGGDWDAARDAANAAITQAKQSGDRFYLYVGMNFLCWAETNLGDYPAAHATRTRTREYGAQLGGALLGADWLAAIRAYIALGEQNISEACALAEEAVLFARGVGGIMAEGLAERAWGQALSVSNVAGLADAQEHFAASIRLFEEGDARMEAARTHQVWGTLLLTHDDANAAQAHLEKAQAQFRRAGLEGSAACP